MPARVLLLRSAIVVFGLVSFIACRDNRGAASVSALEADYDSRTGRLRLLKYDSTGDGQIDTWSYMDGTQTVRIEIDRDQDGKLERWEYYGADQQVEKIGFSRANDGVVDSWAYYTAEGALTRLEISRKRGGGVDRVEYFENGVISHADEDSNGDGRIDKWETYENRRLVSVAFDTTNRGTPDRRLVYGPDGTVRVEALP